jgi:hypothetical protein
MCLECRLASTGLSESRPTGMGFFCFCVLSKIVFLGSCNFGFSLQDLLEAFQVAIMDTGLRKTLISVLLIKETGQAIRSTGVKILIVFLAPTGHLVNEICCS